MKNSFIELFKHPEIFKVCDVNVNGFPGYAANDGWCYFDTGVDNSVSIINSIKAMSNR